jgi:hypothetical protein
MSKPAIIVFLLSVLLITGSNAQTVKPDLDLIFSRPQIRFSLNVLGCAAATISPAAGPHALTASPQIGFEVSFNYLMNIDQNWSFLTGINLGVIGRNYDISISGDEFVPPLGYNLDGFGSVSAVKDVWYLKVPIYIQKRWWVSQKGSCFYLEGGVNLGFGLNGATDVGSDFAFYPNGIPVNYLNMAISLNNQGKPWVGLGAVFGYQWLLKNQNFLGVHLGISYSTASVGNGNYIIIVPNQSVSTGTYQVKDQSIQLGLSYQLTRARKSNRK